MRGQLQGLNRHNAWRSIKMEFTTLDGHIKIFMKKNKPKTKKY